MNIIVRPYGNDSCYCRPDTTWERESKDYYVPESVDNICWTPVLFARISKAGKCIGDRFVQRYYDSFNFGILLYCHRNGYSELAFSSCADHTSLFPFPLYNPVVLENEGNLFKVSKDGNEIFRCNAGMTDIIRETISKASQTISLRIGDFIAAELAAPASLTTRDHGTCTLKSEFCDNPLIDMKVIF